jgi:hypothetical protein
MVLRITTFSINRSVHTGSYFFFSMARQPYMGLGLLVSSRFHDHTHFRHTTVGRTHLDEGPARRRDLYLTTHNTHKRQTSMPPMGFDPTILVSERPKTHALDRTVTGIGTVSYLHTSNSQFNLRISHYYWQISLHARFEVEYRPVPQTSLRKYDSRPWEFT